MDEHSKRAHGGAVPACFPAISMQDAVLTLGAVVSPSIATNKTRSTAVQIINRFLNYVRPGHMVLWNARGEIPKRLWGEGTLEGRPLRSGLFFQDKAFQNNADRITSLAAQTFGNLVQAFEMSDVLVKLSKAQQSVIEWIITMHSSLEVPLVRRPIGGRLEINSTAELLSHWLPTADIFISLPRMPALKDWEIMHWLFERELRRESEREPMKV